MGTDTRGLWYNKQLLAKAGDSRALAPQDVGRRARPPPRQIKKAEPSVTPINIYSGVGTGEATSMQGFEMFLYGTNNPLYDTTANKWEMAGTGFQSVLNVYKQVYSQGLALSPQAALNPNSATVAEQLLPQSKLAIDLDGSWVSSDWAPAVQGWRRTVAAVEQGHGRGCHAYRERAGPG